MNTGIQERFSLTDRLRSTMMVTGAITATNVVMIALFLVLGQSISYSTAVHPSVLLGVTLGLFFGYQMKGYSAATRVITTLVTALWSAFIFAWCVHIIFF